MKKMAYFWRKGLWALCSLFFLGMVCLALLYFYLESQLPDVESLKTVRLQVPLRIYTQDGLLIQEYGEKKRIPLSYDEIPQTLVHAILATEDQRFFEHPGVDIFGLGRAAVRMVQTGSKSQGGSTITMQVARNFFLHRKKTFLRKFNEILLAVKIDKELSKEKILELYLNKIYLGHRAYGVGAAAQVYYGKSLQDLTFAQLAMIAGLPQAPSAHNPISNPIAAKKRRDHVLERLQEEGYITNAQYQTAIHQPVTASYHGGKIELDAPFVAEMIRQSLYDHFGPDAYTRGFKVYTTISGRLQKAANDTVEKNLLAYDRRHGYRGPVAKTNLNNMPAASHQVHEILKPYPVINDLQPALITGVDEQEATAIIHDTQKVTIPWKGLSWARPALKKGWVGKAPTRANQVVSTGDIVYIRKVKQQWQLTQIPQVEAALVALNPENGAIKALVGGFNFEHSKFNRATQSSRQPGSSFKPFVYAAALNKGYSLATLINDAPIVVDDPSQATLWRPHNDNRKFNGPTRFKEGLVRSRNLVSIRILDDIGIHYAVDFISHFGFQKESLPKALSLVLGSLSVSPLELTAAYAVFANGGYKVEPYLIDRILHDDGQILLQSRPTQVCADCLKDDADPDLIAPRVIPEDVAFLMHSALLSAVQHGTGRAANVLNRNDVAGKTGTTNNQVDAWFAGYTQDLVVTTWVGYDSPRSLHEYASRLALPLWIDFMKVALKDKPQRERQPPENVVAVSIDPKTGLLARSNQQNAILEYFREEEIPSMEGTQDTDASPAESRHLFW